jgi:hypothetical protein
MQHFFILFRIFFLLSIAPNALLAQYAMGIPKGYDEAYDQLEQKAPLTRGGILPKAYSLKPYAPYPGNQSSYGTCAAWATAYAARTIYEAVENGWTDRDFITSQAYWAGYQYRLVEPVKVLCDGAFTANVVASLAQTGTVHQEEYSDRDAEFYCPSNGLVRRLVYKASNNKISTTTTLFDQKTENGDFKVSRVKKSISENNPVVISMVCPPSFQRVGNSGLWQPFESPGGIYDYQHGRHAMCVVGYDDNLFGGVFEIQNSWGTNWGNGGYVWIKYEDFGNFVYQAFELVTMQKKRPVPAPEPDPEPEPIPFPEPIDPVSYFEASLRFFDVTRSTDLPVFLEPAGRNWVFNQNGSSSYRVTTPLRTGAKMRLYLKTSEPSYVYVLSTGTVNTSVSTLFPQPGVSAALNYSINEVAFPSEDLYYVMDGTVGTDYLALLFSKSPLDIEELRENVEKGSGSFGSKLHKELNGRLLSINDIDFEANAVSFSANTARNDAIMAFIVSFDHRP